jgi:uncharacterized protein (TIGR02594 family)
MNEPTWLTLARKYNGVRETPGSANNPTIMGWAKRLGAKVLGVAYNADSVPWCGLFIAAVMTEAGFKPPMIAVRASAWDKFGVPLAKPFLGAIVRFQRDGGGHVGIITGQDDKNFRVFGGNQGDTVCETWIAKDRAVAFRWPAGQPLPILHAPMIKRTGTVSKNEA